MALVFLDFQIRFDSVNQGGLGFVLILQDAENPLVNGAGGNNVLNHDGISLLSLAVKTSDCLLVQFKAESESKPDKGRTTGLDVDTVTRSGGVDQSYRDLPGVPSSEAVDGIELLEGYAAFGEPFGYPLQIMPEPVCDEQRLPV